MIFLNILDCRNRLDFFTTNFIAHRLIYHFSSDFPQSKNWMNFFLFSIIICFCLKINDLFFYYTLQQSRKLLTNYNVKFIYMTELTVLFFKKIKEFYF